MKYDCPDIGIRFRAKVHRSHCFNYFRVQQTEIARDSRAQEQINFTASGLVASAYI